MPAAIGAEVAYSARDDIVAVHRTRALRFVVVIGRPNRVATALRAARAPWRFSKIVKRAFEVWVHVQEPHIASAKGVSLPGFQPTLHSLSLTPPLLCLLLSSSFPAHLSLACISSLFLPHLRPGVADGHSIAPGPRCQFAFRPNRRRGAPLTEPNGFARPTTTNF